MGAPKLDAIQTVDLDRFHLILILASYASDKPLKCQITLIGPSHAGCAERF